MSRKGVATPVKDKSPPIYDNVVANLELDVSPWIPLQQNEEPSSSMAGSHAGEAN